MLSAKFFSRIAGKGDGNIRYYEYEGDNLYALDEHKSSDPQRGMCFVPRRAINTSECEIARGYKLTTNAIEPIAFIVPRKVSFPFPSLHVTTQLTLSVPTKSDSFQSDIFPPAPSIEPSLTAGEFFSGKAISLKLVSLETGAVSAAASASSPSLPSLGSGPAPGPGPGPTRSSTAPAPQSAQTPSLSPIIAPPLIKVASEPPSTSVFVPLTPADVQIPPSRSVSTYTSDVRSLSKLLVDINDVNRIL